MKCDYCTEKCPQAETICELAKGRMYATNEVIKLQKQLEEYKTLEEQGLLLRLPCKVGDIVYLIKSDREIVPRTADMQFLGVLWDDYGKEWFLTQAEAEQKLKEMRCKL